MDWKIFEKLRQFLSQDPSLQTLQQAWMLEMELRDKLYPLEIFETEFDQAEKAFKVTRAKYPYEEIEMPYNLRIEIPTLLDNFTARLRELTTPPIDGPHIKPYLEDPKKPFSKDWKDYLMKLRQYLRQERVKEILGVLKSHQDRVFVIYFLEPLIHSKREWAVPDPTKGEVDPTGEIVSERTLTRTITMRIDKSSKPGPQDPEGANPVIIFLSIHFKKCLGIEHYGWIADLLSLCQGKRWTEHAVKMRITRLRKGKDWNGTWWEGYYEYQRGLCDDISGKSGLGELVRRYSV